LRGGDRKIKASSGDIVRPCLKKKEGGERRRKGKEGELGDWEVRGGQTGTSEFQLTHWLPTTCQGKGLETLDQAIAPGARDSLHSGGLPARLGKLGSEASFRVSVQN
jgi:hypothetical protein